MPPLHLILESPLATQHPPFCTSLIPCAADGSQPGTHDERLVGFSYSLARVDPCAELRAANETFLPGTTPARDDSRSGADVGTADMERRALKAFSLGTEQHGFQLSTPPWYEVGEQKQPP